MAKKNYVIDTSVYLSDADCIFISCGGIRSIDVIDEIEEVVNKPVVTSNQAMMWSCLRRIGVTDNLKGYGRLFKRDIQLN